MTDYLEMSDDDFINAPAPSITEETETALPTEEESTEEPVEVIEESVEDDNQEQEEDYIEEDSEEEGHVPEGEEESEDTDPADEPSTENETDLGLERLLKPFKANGVEVQAKTADEAMTLMQMGANYTKKMQALQPNLKLLKALEKHDLLDEGKLNNLIDLSKKDPKAIAALVKDAGINPMDIEEDVEYTPNDNQVSSQVIQLEQVIEDISNTPTGDRCVDVVGNQWDEASKRVLTQDPSNIRDLNEQMRLGIFDKINAEVTRVRMFGGLSGQSDFDAYRNVGKAMMERGELDANPKPTVVASTEIKGKPKNTALSNKRKAASSPKPTSKKTSTPKVNPLGMDDDEFLKINKINL